MYADILEKPFGEVTVNDFFSLFFAGKNIIGQREQEIQKEQEPEEPSWDKFDYGIDGLARILGCGKTRAQEIKNTGLLDRAITKAGRKLMIHREKAKHLYEVNKHRLEN
ncbi:DUF3853 family protein [Elizabethkingia meningoseptica]|uniref:DUF3853 family protein n=1 Tax=Elizabethkingia meningoseptica TaxID=238 RepID=UPI0038923630